jgi:hypothetical protein
MVEDPFDIRPPCGARFSVPLSASADSSAPGELKFAAAR